ncbi:hypothetical protein Cadr_000019460 [Camelus dromedarius]|uniref:Uncharacterized protein n=1 Tax=Camelus dromedarius TaxID=9838 RepID=A0A5N4D119_CAMDR|nr:hypothetical protein Cadr_000019460 [Camelus dromedarius]
MGVRLGWGRVEEVGPGAANPTGVHRGIQASGRETHPGHSLHGKTKASWTHSGQGLRRVVYLARPPADTVASHRLAKSWQPRRVPAASSRPLGGALTATAWVGRGWFIIWVDWWLRHVGIFCATLGAWWPLRNGSGGPTWAHVRKAGMSRTGTFLVSAFTRRFRSSVSSTTSRSSRIGSSVGMREQRDFTEGRRQRHWLPLLRWRGKRERCDGWGWPCALHSCLQHRVVLLPARRVAQPTSLCRALSPDSELREQKQPFSF